MKNAMIFGDSYSTFKGFVPSNYAIYYGEGEAPESGVTHVSHTWWYQVCEEGGLQLVLNNSFSGSTIGYTGYGNTDCSHSTSFIYRLKQLKEKGFFEENQIDTVFVFGGTNDSWSNAPLGEEKYGDWEEEELFSVLPAIGYFLNLLKETVPKATIYCLINTEIKREITDCMKQACARLNIVPVTFESIDKKDGHPTREGMKDIKESVLKAMNA